MVIVSIQWQSTASGEKIKSASIVEIVSLIREAKESVPTRFSRWVKGDPKEGPRYGAAGIWIILHDGLESGRGRVL